MTILKKTEKSKKILMLGIILVVLAVAGMAMAGAVSADDGSAVDDGSTAVTDEEWTVVTTMKELEKAVEAGGNIRIGKTISMGGQLDIKTKVTLDLNGCELRFRHKWHININSGGDLTITDSSNPSTGKIMGGKTKGDGGCIYVDSNASLTLNAGTIRDGYTSNNGGGVYVNTDGKFTMTGGTIENNRSDSGKGGGVYLNTGAEFSMEGGTIEKNFADNYGGGGMCIVLNLP